MAIDKEIFSHNLKYLLNKNHLRQTDLADKLFMSKGAVSNYISGKYSPRRDIADKIAAFFSVTFEELTKLKMAQFSTSMEEGDEHIYIVPMFLRTLQNDIVLYDECNFSSSFYIPFPAHSASECYAVRVYDDLMENHGIKKGSVVFFAACERVFDDELAAVYLKAENTIVIKSVKSDEKKLTLTDDKKTKTYRNYNKTREALVLGKVISLPFVPDE